MPWQLQILQQTCKPCTDGNLEEQQLNLEFSNAQRCICQQSFAFLLQSKWTDRPDRTNNHLYRLLRFPALCELRRLPYQHRIRGI